MNDIGIKRIRLSSWLLAAMFVTFLGYLGVNMPAINAFLTADPEIQYFLGPSRVLRYAHWLWTVPVGLVVGVSVVWKDRIVCHRTASRLNAVMLSLIICLVALFLQGIYVVRMVQIVR